MSEDLEVPNDVSKVLDNMRATQDNEKEAESQTKVLKDSMSSLFHLSKEKANQIQEEADHSKIAGLLNHLMFSFIRCNNHELKEEDIEKINPGGGIVSSISVLVPGLPLNHPFIILSIRMISVYITVRRICNRVHESMDNVSDKINEVKESFGEVIHHS